MDGTLVSSTVITIAVVVASGFYLLEPPQRAAWGPTAFAVVALIALYDYAFRPNHDRSHNYHDPTSKQYREMRSRCFFPAFANGWHAVCNSEDIRDGRVKSIKALGTHMVAFRGKEDGKAGVLHAFCPHLGAHLGEDGTVEGNLLVCPFHRWSFDIQGQCKRIPYMPEGCAVPDRAQTKAYVVREQLGVVYVWLHAEEEHAFKPLWELEVGRDLEALVSKKQYYYAVGRRMEYRQHSCEMAMNSADRYHFETLHGPFPVPLVQSFVRGDHRIKTVYGTGIVAGEQVQRPHLTLFKEKTHGLYMFGNKSIPVPLSRFMALLVDTTVTFEGPTIMHFQIDTPFGQMRQIKTILSVEPFKQYVEAKWYAQACVPRFVVGFFAWVASRALEQDRTVWENKMFRRRPMLVRGDGPFPAFIRWYDQFYSEHSKDLENRTLDW